MKITIITYLENETAKEHDVVVDQVARALRAGKHTPSILGVHGDLRKLVSGLGRRKPDLVFNLMEMFGQNVRADVAIAGVLDLLELRYTGGGPAELALRQDKALAKRALAFDGILYPDFAVFSRDDFETGGNLKMPLFVKPLRADASIGIGANSLVKDATSLMKRVIAIHEKFNDSALAEEYIEGREFYVGVLGNREPVAFPPVEMDFSGLPEGAPRILDSKAKWAKNSVEYKGTKSIMPDLPDELRARLQKVALDAYRALRVRDYGRVDLRLTETGEIYVIEVNANCYLEASGEFATSAASAGLDYDALIQRLVDLATERYDRAS
ncbi:D-alanine--D-alanine ligase family protein [Tundrisphaera sp. TA3]|uniref:D-alanine--D-alanine ligase family protein n=1 Tax=Tundrisphaera sp. TA3 TaxID=3435775 RepID=UPI003EB8BAB3